MTHVTSLLLGLGNGGVYAALAIALVLTYRSSGVVNFATGTIALFTAYTYAFLRNGQLLVLVPGLPTTVDLKVADTVPGIKGATASAQVKPATLETGLVVTVPSFINTGDKIRVNTETGEYLSRV